MVGINMIGPKFCSILNHDDSLSSTFNDFFELWIQSHRWTPQRTKPPNLYQCGGQWTCDLVPKFFDNVTFNVVMK